MEYTTRSCHLQIKYKIRPDQWQSAQGKHLQPPLCIVHVEIQNGQKESNVERKSGSTMTNYYPLHLDPHGARQTGIL